MHSDPKRLTRIYERNCPRFVPFLLAAAAITVTVFAMPATARAAIQAQANPVRFYTLSAGRLSAIVAGLVGIAGAIIGKRALARAERGNGRPGAIAALTMGPFSILLGGFVVATAEGGLGTGHGLGGGVVAMVIGTLAMTLGGLALVRSRRNGVNRTGQFPVEGH